VSPPGSRDGRSVRLAGVSGRARDLAGLGWLGILPGSAGSGSCWAGLGWATARLGSGFDRLPNDRSPHDRCVSQELVRPPVRPPQPTDVHRVTGLTVKLGPDRLPTDVPVTGWTCAGWTRAGWARVLGRVDMCRVDSQRPPPICGAAAQKPAARSHDALLAEAQEAVNALLSVRSRWTVATADHRPRKGC